MKRIYEKFFIFYYLLLLFCLYYFIFVFVFLFIFMFIITLLMILFSVIMCSNVFNLNCSMFSLWQILRQRRPPPPSGAAAADALLLHAGLSGQHLSHFRAFNCSRGGAQGVNRSRGGERIGRRVCTGWRGGDPAGENGHAIAGTCRHSD
jgi:hypothetical protein